MEQFRVAECEQRKEKVTLLFSDVFFSSLHSNKLTQPKTWSKAVKELRSNSHLFSVLRRTSKPINMIPTEREKIGKGWFRWVRSLAFFSSDISPLLLYPAADRQYWSSGPQQEARLLYCTQVFPGQMMNHTQTSNARYKWTGRAIKQAVSAQTSQTPWGPFSKNELKVCKISSLYRIWGLEEKSTECSKQVPWSPEERQITVEILFLPPPVPGRGEHNE